jgi:hypothetical protein
MKKFLFVLIIAASVESAWAQQTWWDDIMEAADLIGNDFWPIKNGYRHPNIQLTEDYKLQGMEIYEEEKTASGGFAGTMVSEKITYRVQKAPPGELRIFTPYIDLIKIRIYISDQNSKRDVFARLKASLSVNWGDYIMSEGVDSGDRYVNIVKRNDRNGGARNLLLAIGEESTSINVHFTLLY